MRPLGKVRWVCALMLMAAGAAPAEAAWDNVFQVCCNSCGGNNRPIISRFFNRSCAPPCCAAPAPCCPAPCTTNYVQRSYYQPVTCYQTRTYYEPVTSYRTSYFYQPVTSYSYSCYYDPCTCSYQQVACPSTSYQLRSQTCAVQSYLQRTCQVPVTSYRLQTYYEPVTTCAPACPAPAPCCPTSTSPGVSEQITPVPSSAGQPGVSESTSPANKSGEDYQRYYQPPLRQDGKKPASESSYRQPAPFRPRNLPDAPKVRLDRIVALPGSSSQVQGQVVTSKQAPRSGAKVLFVSTTRQGPQESVTADRSGQFHVTLASGGWLVYLNGPDGKLTFHSKIEVRPEQNRQVLLVSR